MSRETNARIPAVVRKGNSGPAEYGQAVFLLAVWLALVMPLASQYGPVSLLNEKAYKTLDAQLASENAGGDGVQGDACSTTAAALTAESLAIASAEGEAYADDMGALLCWLKRDNGIRQVATGFLQAASTFSDTSLPIGIIVPPPAFTPSGIASSAHAGPQSSPEPEPPPPRPA